jgi:hypothetical protein
MKFAPALAALSCLLLSACKPPATDGFVEREARAKPSEGPSQPLDSPETEGAIWSTSATPMRLIYGRPGEPALLAMACEHKAGPAQLRFTRFARADKGAQAFLALIGNGHVARIPVDAIESQGQWIWEGYSNPSDQRMEAFSGARAVTATIPGAGMVRLNASPLTSELVEACAAQSEQPISDPAQPG